MCTGGNDNKVFIYDLRNQNIIGEYTHNAAVKAIAWINNKTVITGGGTADKKIKLRQTVIKCYEGNRTDFEVTNKVTC